MKEPEGTASRKEPVESEEKALTVSRSREDHRSGRGSGTEDRMLKGKLT